MLNWWLRGCNTKESSGKVLEFRSKGGEFHRRPCIKDTLSSA